jgi:tRNA A-37 threonylcarbamoyl transferase component Bud32
MKNKLSEEMSWKKLARVNSGTISLPFQLTLIDSDKPLICQEVLRIVPGKRLVVSARWDDQIVVAKLFYSRDAKRHVKRDIEGADILQHANVPAPKLLYRGSTHKKRTQVIIFEKIEECASLESIWQNRNQYLEVDALMRSFTVELATQHVLGIVQQDLHFNNFLVTDKRIYTLDGGAITHVDNPLDKKTSLENLGLFFAQLGAGTEELQRELFSVYVKARGWLVKTADLELLQTSLKKSWQDRWRRYHKKIFRNCSAFKKIDKVFKTIIYDREYQSPALLNLLQHPEEIFTDANTVLLKKGRSATVAKFTLDHRTFVIKRYNLKNTVHWFRRCLRETRAKTTWRLAQRLCLFGISTAKPIAYIENHYLGLRGKSYFLMEYVPGQHSGDFFAAFHADDPQFEFVAKRILMLFQQLSELQITHGDLKNTNIIIHREQPYLIDLDGMSEHKLRLRFQRAYKKELRRFMRNWESMPSIFALFTELLKGINYDGFAQK